MRDISIDITGVLTASVTPDEFRRGERLFYHDGQQYSIFLMTRRKDGAIIIRAKKSDEKDDLGSLREYPVGTRFSPKGTTTERLGKIENRRGKRKFKSVTDEKPYVPLRGDGADGRGEARRKYIR